jgi:hypothetical protein
MHMLWLAAEQIEKGEGSGNRGRREKDYTAGSSPAAGIIYFHTEVSNCLYGQAQMKL